MSGPSEPMKLSGWMIAMIVIGLVVMLSPICFCGVWAFVAQPPGPVAPPSPDSPPGG